MKKKTILIALAVLLAAYSVFETAGYEREKKLTAELSESVTALEERVRTQQEELDKTAKKVIWIALVVFVLVAVLFGNLIYQIIQLSKQRDAALENLEQLNEKVDELQSTLDRVTSLDYIEQQARYQLRMIYPGEKLYVVEDEQ